MHKRRAERGLQLPKQGQLHSNNGLPNSPTRVLLLLQQLVGNAAVTETLQRQGFVAQRQVERDHQEFPQQQDYRRGCYVLSWAGKVRKAMDEKDLKRRGQMYLDLVNEALSKRSEYAPFLPVRMFVSEAAGDHKKAYFDANSGGEPGESGSLRGMTCCGRCQTASGECEEPDRVFVVLTPSSLHPDAGPEFTQRAFLHEFVHVKQNIQGEKRETSACKPTWKGKPMGGNSNRELEAVGVTFTRFFPAWADYTTRPVGRAPRHLFEDLALLQIHYPCAKQEVRANVIGRIVDCLRPNPVIMGMRLLSLAADVNRESSLKTSQQNAMKILSEALIAAGIQGVGEMLEESRRAAGGTANPPKPGRR